MGWNLTSHMYTTNFKNIFFLSRGVSRCYEDTCNSCSQLSYLSSSGPHVLTSSFHAYQCFGFHFLYKRNYNLAHVLLVPRSKRITCVCLHLGHSVHWRRLQTSGSHGLSSISTPADAPLLAEGEKSQTKIYWHCQLPWQADRSVAQYIISGQYSLTSLTSASPIPIPTPLTWFSSGLFLSSSKNCDKQHQISVLLGKQFCIKCVPLSYKLNINPCMILLAWEVT